MVDKINFESLQPEYFTEPKAWLDFITATAEVLQEQIREPIGEIEQIRNIIEGSDPVIIANSIKQLGFNLPADIIAHNAERLAKSIYMLALFHETSGIEGYVESISFVLGRDLKVEALYTNNYVDFYEKPFGPLLIDGGDWYLTTHISLGMELIPSDEDLVLPETKTLADRLRDAYFEFAPINQVVKNFYYMIGAKATLGITGVVVPDPTHRIELGSGVESVQALKILAPSIVSSGQTIQLSADVLFVSTGCYDIGSPVYGAAPDGIDNDAEITSSLTTTASNSNFVLNLNIGAGQYGYFAAPRELGIVSFYLNNGGIEGGWDGAFGLGPESISRDIGGEIRTWNLYRTDMPALGAVTYNVVFEFSGTINSCDIKLGEVAPTPPTNAPITGTINLLPLTGTELSGIDTDIEIETLLITEVNPENLILVISETGVSDYAYLAYPVEFGLATFFDVGSGFFGGWDGASWTTYVGNTFGPIIVSRTIGNETSDWYLYRTDFPGIGAVTPLTFEVTFANPGAIVTHTTSEPITSNDIPGYPRWGSGFFGIDTSIEIDSIPNVNTDTFAFDLSVDLGLNEYGYLAYPAEMGLATFLDTGSGFLGGWDGAQWAEGAADGAYGPATIMRTINGASSAWHVYRTDFPNIGQFTFRVTFENEGLDVSEPVVVPISDPDYLPVMGEGPSGVDSANDINSVLTTTLPSQNTQNITIDLASGEYAYFAHPADLGLAHFTDTTTGFRGGWQGASWPLNGDIGTEEGPIVVYRTKQGKLEPWYLYRTDFPGLGILEFEVTFGHVVTPGTGAFRTVQLILPEWTTDRPDIVSISETGEVSFASVGVDTVVSITTTFNGVSNTVQIVVQAVPSNLVSLEISGLSVIFGGETRTYTVTGTFENGTVAPVLDAVITALSPIVTVDHYDIITGNPLEDTDLFLQASKFNNDGVLITVAKAITVTRTSTEKRVVSMAIVGPTSIEENTGQQYSAVVSYSDGSSVPELVLWSSSSPGLHVDQQGFASAGIPLDSFQAALYATFQYKGVVNTTAKNIEITLKDLSIVSMTIYGATSAFELTKVQYKAVLLWSDGKSSIADAEWTSSKFHIDSNGLMQMGSVGSNITVKINASARGFNAPEFTVAVAGTPINLDYISISGPDNVNEEVVQLNPAKYRAFSHFSDGHVEEILAPQWSIMQHTPDVIPLYDMSFVDINSSGDLTFNNPTLGVVSIKVSYYDGLVLHEDNKQVVLIPTISVISALTISGPSEVLEGQRVDFVATALFMDGSTSTAIVPLWTVESEDPVNVPDTPADIVSPINPATVQGRIVEEDTLIIITARYFRETATMPVVVKNYLIPGPDVPVSSRIAGPLVIGSNERGSYTLYTIFDNACVDELAMSNDWSLDVDSSVAAIDGDGYLRSVNGLSATVLITASWEYAGHTILETYVVQIIETIGRLANLIINGPTLVQEQATHSYFVELFREGSAIVPGSGEAAETTVEWFVETTPGVSISQNGQVTVGDVQQGASFLITAKLYDVGFTIENSLEVFVSTFEEPFTTLLIGGPSVAHEQTVVNFSAEGFRLGAPIIASTGEVLPATWSVSPEDGSTISSAGVLTLADILQGKSYTVTASYTDASSTIVGTKNLTVTSDLAAVSALIISGLSEVSEESTYQYSVESFRAPPISPGLGEVPNPAFISWGVSPSAGLAITSSGILTIGSFDSPFPAVLTVAYNDGVNPSVSANYSINVYAEIENTAPTINNATFSLSDTASIGTVIGNLVASDTESDPLTFTIASGNTSNIFGLTTSGELSVADNALLSASSPTHTLTVQVSDGVFSSTANITVNIVITPPVVTNQSVDLPEGVYLNASYILYTMIVAPATDVTWSIIGGNSSGFFSVTPNTGSINVLGPNSIDAPSYSVFNLTLRATRGNISDNATLTVNVINASPLSNGNNNTLYRIQSYAAVNAIVYGTSGATDAIYIMLDPSPLTLTIIGGTGSSTFALTEQTFNPEFGSTRIKFKVKSTSDLSARPPGYEYSLIIRSHDGLDFTDETITINVT